MSKSSSDWGFVQVWNESLTQRENRVMEPRDRIWASELGKAPIDVWLAMNAVKPTNVPNKRSLRKFEAGNIWEWIIELILTRSGILQSSQDYIVHQYPGLLNVSGKLDFLAGGNPDYEKAESELENLNLPEVFIRGGRHIVKYLKENYPDGLESKILEIKSASEFTFSMYERLGKASINHRLQNFHYLKGMNVERGAVIYVSKDDCRMLEFPVMNPSPIEDEYKKAIERLTYYYNKNERPPLEDLISFDHDLGKFNTSWYVAYSGYLKMLYGFDNPEQYMDKYKPKCGRWNRVLSRIADGKDLTQNNLDAVKEMEVDGFNMDDIRKFIKPTKPKKDA